jgi:hypothetical protein
VRIRPEFFSCALAAGTALLLLPGILLAQRQLENPYWKHRQAVLLAVTWDKDLRFSKVMVLEDHARPALADSLLEAAPCWTLPEWLRPPPGRAAHRAYTLCEAFVADRTESSNPSARRLPEPLRDFLSRGSFAEWMREVSRGDSLATWADFVVFREKALWPYGLSKEYPDLLHSPQMLEKRRFDLLHPSPGGEWVLDPFQGIEVDSLGRLGSDIDTGYRVYEASTGNCLYHDVSTIDWITLAAWTSDSCFVMVGSAAVDLRCDIPTRAPVVWIGDMHTGRLTTFLGAPFSHWKEHRVWDGWHRVFRKVYPKIRSVP